MCGTDIGSTAYCLTHTYLAMTHTVLRIPSAHIQHATRCAVLALAILLPGATRCAVGKSHEAPTALSSRSRWGLNLSACSAMSSTNVGDGAIVLRAH
eukprot:3941451-Rhodomonas_salina.4